MRAGEEESRLSVCERVEGKKKNRVRRVSE